MLRLLFPLFLLLGGCVSLDDVVGGIANTPDWFQKRRVEIRGDGYPKFSDVPAETDEKALGLALEKTETDLRATQKAFANDPRAEPAQLTQDDIAALSNRLKAQLPDNIERTDPLLSDADIAKLKASLKPPPITK